MHGTQILWGLCLTHKAAQRDQNGRTTGQGEQARGPWVPWTWKNHSLLCGRQKAKEPLRASSENSGVGTLITSEDLGMRTSYGHYGPRRWRK